jgi:hypothetical protein
MVVFGFVVVVVGVFGFVVVVEFVGVLVGVFVFVVWFVFKLSNNGNGKNGGLIGEKIG